MHLPPFKAVNQKEYLMNQNAHYINVYFKPDAFYTYGCYSGSQWESIFPTMHQNTEQTCNHKIERSDWNIHDTTNSHYPFINHTKKWKKITIHGKHAFGLTYKILSVQLVMLVCQPTQPCPATKQLYSKCFCRLPLFPFLLALFCDTPI